MRTRSLFYSIPALAALALIAPGANAQINPYQGVSNVPPFVSLGYGAPPMALSPYGSQFYFGQQMPMSPYGGYNNSVNPYANPGPNSYYGNNGYYGGQPVIQDNGAYGGGYPYYAPANDYANPAYGPNGYYAPENGYNMNTAYGPNGYYAPARPVLPRTSDTIQAHRDVGGQILLNWQGDSRAVERITVALLDKNQKVLKQQTITAPPTQIRMTKVPNTAYYRMTVYYLNGATNTVTSPIF